jgi:hypothetical protein
VSTLQKFWTFGQMLDKVQDDTDISDTDPDEQFVTFNGFIGFFNEAIDEGEAEVMGLDEDYFLSKDSLIMIEGVSEYEMPENIFADKLRGIIFDDESERYQIRKMRRKELFLNIHRAADTANGDAAYQHYIRNDIPGQRKFVLTPPARTSSTPPTADLIGDPTATPPVLPEVQEPFDYPITRYYIRNANRVPYIGDFVNGEDLYPAAFDLATGIITVSPTFPYVSGDTVRFNLKSTAFTMPAGLSAGVDYFVVRLSDTQIKLAPSLANVRAYGAAQSDDTNIQETLGQGDGSNLVFTLSETPLGDAYVMVLANGVLQRKGLHYTIVGRTITFLVAPAADQTIEAVYRNDATQSLSDPTQYEETPAGLVDGANKIFVLANTPTSNQSVKIYLDGDFQTQGVHYTIVGKTITFVTAPALLQVVDAIYDTTVLGFTSQGVGFFTMKVKATRAIILATVIDIPEFSTFIMEWVKANCLFKEGDPRLQGCIAKLEQQRKQLNDTLSNREPDDDNTMELDLSFYEDMN